MSYEEYSSKYISLFTNYLYGNETAENTLKQIDYLTSIYFIKNNSTIGRTVVFVTSSILFIMLFTYLIVLSNKYKIYFCRYHKMIWSSMFVGLFIYISQNYFLIGELTELKCKARIICILFGLTLFFTPLFIYEIINFPESNKYSKFIYKKRYITLISLIMVDFILMLLTFFLSSYQIKTEIIENGMNFHTCLLTKNFHIIYIIISVIIKIFVVLSIILLTFLEWNVDITYVDIQNISYILYLNIIMAFVFIILRILIVNNIYIYYANIIIYNFLSTITSYFIIIWIRVYQEHRRISTKNDIIITKRKNTIQKSNVSSVHKKNIISKIINYHYSQGSSSIYVAESEKNTQIYSTKPEIELYTSIIFSNEMTDIHFGKEITSNQTILKK
ncbi:hypothetical protein BCR32DRAFT_272543 [Anaeromyces robustus]|uniref:G-protein coupled receptors family 3 profile domain-containing protein n=1 Tax=Anaeromyces robustus TaxID=1754192 RepID=A0A1Y1W3G5_9FUNG|nr:hypothetical protein BCR32DRAFT_272543 [Anaeromyces robustus]|eukprot:ORX68070.1 hypothetical protein BCR32DRAFT_272543 [Anaeromyces robustus]